MAHYLRCFSANLSPALRVLNPPAMCDVRPKAYPPAAAQPPAQPPAYSAAPMVLKQEQTQDALNSFVYADLSAADSASGSLLSEMPPPPPPPPQLQQAPAGVMVAPQGVVMGQYGYVAAPGFGRKGRSETALDTAQGEVGKVVLGPVS